MLNDYPFAIAIVTLGFFSIATPICALLLFRLGFTPAYLTCGIPFVVVLSILRIVGSAVSVYGRNNVISINLQTIIFIFSSVGLSFVILAISSLITRHIAEVQLIHDQSGEQPAGMTGYMNRKARKALTRSSITIAVILSVVGGINTGDELTSTGIYEVRTESKIGVSILTAVTLIMSGEILIFRYKFPEIRTAAIQASLFCIPFLVVRIVYSLLGVFYKGTTFIPSAGNPTAHLFMFVLSEFILVALIMSAASRYERMLDVNVDSAGSTGRSRGPGGLIRGLIAKHTGQNSTEAYDKNGNGGAVGGASSNSRGRSGLIRSFIANQISQHQQQQQQQPNSEQNQNYNPGANMQSVGSDQMKPQSYTNYNQKDSYNGAVSSFVSKGIEQEPAPTYSANTGRRGLVRSFIAKRDDEESPGFTGGGMGSGVIGLLASRRSARKARRSERRR